MTAPVIVDYFIQNNSIDNQTIDHSVPGNAGGNGFTGIAGHLILGVYFKRDGFVEPLPVPSGYTLLEEIGGTGGFTDGIGVFAMDAVGGETGFAFPDVTGGGSGDILALFLLDGGAVADLITSEVSGTSSPIVGTITPTSGVDTLLFAFGTSGHESLGSWSVDSNWTILDQRNHGSSHPIDFEATRTVTNPSGAYTITATEVAGENKRLIMVSVKGEPPVTPPIVPGPIFSVDGVAFDNLLEARVRFEWNAPGAGYMVLSRDDPQAIPSMVYRGAIVQCTFPEIHEDPIFEFYLESGDFDAISSDEEGGEELRFGGPGTLSILRRAIVRSVEYLGGIGYPKPKRGVWVFDESNTEGHILNKLLREAQAASRPAHPLAGMTDTFTSTLDSDGVTWADQELEGRWRVKIGANLYDAALRLVNSGLMSIEMYPGLVLNAWRAQGTDRHSSSFAPGKVRFVKGVNIVDELNKGLAGQHFATHAEVKYVDNDDDIHYINATKDAGDFSYDKEVYIESEATHANTARKQAKHAMKLREDLQDAIEFAHVVPWPGKVDGDPSGDDITTVADESNGWYLPGPPYSDHGSYWLGDLVTLHTGSDSSEYEWNNATKRVYAITLYKDTTGYLAPPIIELNAPRKRSGFNRVIAGISGTLSDLGTGSSSGGGGGGGGGGGSSPPVVIGGGYQPLAEKGDPEGYAALDDDGVVPSDQLATGTPDIGYVPVYSTGGVVVWAPINAVGDPVALVSDSSTWDGVIDYDLARAWYIILTDDTTLTSIDNPPPDGYRGLIEVYLEQGTGAPHTFDWDGLVDFPDTDGTPGGADPTLKTALGAKDVIFLRVLDGANWGGSYDGTSGGPGGAIELQEDGVTRTATMSTLNVRHALDADASGNVDVDESEFTTALLKTTFNAKGDLLTATANDTPSIKSVGSNGQRFTPRSANADGLAWEDEHCSISFELGDGSGVIATGGPKGMVRIDFDCTIIGWDVEEVTATSTTSTFDLKKRASGGGAASWITASAKPSITAGTENASTTLTGWTTTISAGDKLYIHVDTNNNGKQFTLTLKVKRT